MLIGVENIWEFASFLLAVISALVSVVWGLWIYLGKRKRKLLTYELDASASIVNVHKDAGDDIRVTTIDGDEEVEVTEARILIIKFANVGAEIIEKEDFKKDNPIRLAFPGDNVLRYGVQKLFPEDRVENTKALVHRTEEGGNDHIILSPFAMQPKDWVTVKVLVREDKGFKVYGHITGGRIEQASTSTSGWPASRVLTLGALCLATGLTAPSLFSPVGDLWSGRCGFGDAIVSSSSALAPSIKSAASEYNRKCIFSHITALDPGSSGAVIREICDPDGNVEIGATEWPDPDLASVKVKPFDLKRIVFALVVNRSVEEIESISKKDVRRIYNRELTNWSEIGGPDLPIFPISRSQFSGTRKTFEKVFMAGSSEYPAAGMGETATGEMAKKVADTPGAIGYVELDTARSWTLDKRIDVLNIDNQMASKADMNSSSYDFVGEAKLYVREPASRTATSFANFLCSGPRSE